MQKNHEMKTKAVSFNVLDPDQKKLLEHALKRKNFSAYVKRLIQRDLESTFYVQQPQMQMQSTSNVEEEKEVSFDADLMKNLI